MEGTFDVKRKLNSLSAIMGNTIFQKKGSIYIFKKSIQDQKQWLPMLFFFQVFGTLNHLSSPNNAAALQLISS